MTDPQELYEKWVAKAREDGHNTESEVFKAGFEAGYNAANLEVDCSADDYDMGYDEGLEMGRRDCNNG